MSRRSYQFCGSILLLFSFLHCLAQPQELVKKNIVFEQLPAELGLGQRAVNEIMQDSEGYMWISTWSGLIRYDGRISKIYGVGDHEGDLKSSKITSVCEGKNGDLWVGSRAGGLFRYDRLSDSFTPYSQLLPELLPFRNIWDLEIDLQGNLWLATEEGLVSIKGDQVTVYDVSRGLSDNFITSIYKDSQHRFWLTTDHGLNHFDPQKGVLIRKYYYEFEGEDRRLHNFYYEATSIFHNGIERIFATSKKGLKEVTGEGLVNYMSPSTGIGYNLFNPLVAIQGDKPVLLIGSAVGIHVFDVEKGKFSRFIGENSNLSHHAIMYLFFDRTGVLWVGTKKGVNKFDTYDKDFRLFKNSLFNKPEGILTGINKANDQTVISTLGGGLFHFDLSKETFHSIDIVVNEENDFTDFIQKLFIDSAGNVYLGTAGNGVYRFPAADIIKTGFRISDYQNYNLTSGFGDNYIMSFAGGNDGGVWVGTWSGGLSKIFGDGAYMQFQHEMLFEAPIVSLLQNGNTLWVGSRGNGLYQYTIEGNQLRFEKRYARGATDKLSSDFVSVLFKDSKNRFWVGTESGLNLFDERCECFKAFDKSDGLETNEATSIQEDDKGRLWVSNWSGLSVITYHDSNRVELNYHFDRTDRIQGDFFYNEVSFKDESGFIFMGGSNGFNVLDPDKVINNPFEPEVLITDMKVFGKSLYPQEELNERVILTERIQKTDEVVLKHDENSIELVFSAVHYAHPSKNRFQYKLEGFEEKWHEANQSVPTATYTNLPDREYIFLLKASNNDGLWQATPRKLKIVILPPWWRTIWAYFLFAGIIILLLIGFRYLIIARTTYESNLRMAERERENLEETNKAKLKFFTNISHEFRTPLTLILGPIERLLEIEGNNKQTKQQLNIVKSNASRLLRLINQLLDFRKVETGNLKLNVAEGNFVKFVNEVKLSFDLRAEELGINFNIYSSSNVIDLYFDRDQFEKILYNLLSNAFKSTPRGGEIIIKIIENEKDVELRVIDTGAGIAKENFDMIFNRFYSNDGTLEGTGIGLSLVNSLVRLHRANIDFDSIEGEKTEFKISIQKGKKHLSEDEIIADFKSSESIEKYLIDEDAIIDSEEEQVDTKPIEDLDKILIVEDNKDVRAFIKSIFLKKYVILEAEDGKQALNLAIEEVPNLVISDVMMPVMDGIALCKKLKTNTKTSHIPVILLTARTSLIFEAEGYESGADDYISKPFSSGLLQVRVKNMIDSRKKLQQAFSQQQGQGKKVEPSMISYTSADELFVKSALQSIENNMSNSEYSVDDLGKDVGLSRMQLYRKLKAMVGVSANEFIRNIRLTRAAQLLKTNQYTVAEVTYMCGFVDLQYFRRCFKKQFKVTPSDYQASDEEENA